MYSMEVSGAPHHSIYLMKVFSFSCTNAVLLGIKTFVMAGKLNLKESEYFWINCAVFV